MKSIPRLSGLAAIALFIGACDRDESPHSAPNPTDDPTGEARGTGDLDRTSPAPGSPVPTNPNPPPP